MNEPNEKWFKMVCKMMGEAETRIMDNIHKINELNKRLDKQEEVLQMMNTERSSLKIILTKAAERMEYIESYLEQLTEELGGEVQEAEDEDLSKDRILN